MVRSLVIYDVSSVIYAGTESRYGSDYFGNKVEGQNLIKGLPVGGVRRLLNQALMTLRAGDAVLLCFDSWTSRKDKDPNYKGNRTKNPEVYAQNGLLLEIAKDIGLPFLKIEGYEADDLIASVVRQYHDIFMSIKIVTGDSDIAANIISKKVHIEGSASIYPDIDIQNFTTALGKPGLRFNEILPYYFYFGKKSNNVPKLFKESSKCANYYRRFSEFCDSKGYKPEERSMDYILADWILSIQDEFEDPSYVDRLVDRMDLIYPRIIEDPDKLKFEYTRAEQLNTDSLKNVFKVYGLYRLAKMYKLDDVMEMTSMPREYLKRVMYWKSVYDNGGEMVLDDVQVDVSHFVNRTTRFTESVGDF